MMIIDLNARKGNENENKMMKIKRVDRITSENVLETIREKSALRKNLVKRRDQIKCRAHVETEIFRRQS